MYFSTSIFLLLFLMLLDFCPQTINSDLFRLALDAKNVIGALRHGIRRTACDVLRNGQIYHQPCDQFSSGHGLSRPKDELVEKEVVIEEVDPRRNRQFQNSHQHRKPHSQEYGESWHRRDEHLDRYGQREQPKFIIEEEEEVYTTPKPVVQGEDRS